MNKIRLLLIEDNRLMWNGITAMLKDHRDIKVIAASGNSEDTVSKIHLLKPNVILLDIGLRSQNSLRILEVVQNEFPKAKVIVMDLAPVQGDIIKYVKAGASGFILKDITPKDFLITIRSVAKGKKVLPPHLSGTLFSEIIEHAIKQGKTKLKEAVRMTKRERDVITLISEGLSHKEISLRLRIPTNTIKSHVHNIMQKLVLHTRLEVTNYAASNNTLKTITEGISLTSR
jgi:DNA-binding NarL/FixJ family response regulator